MHVMAASLTSVLRLGEIHTTTTALVPWHHMEHCPLNLLQYEKLACLGRNTS